MISRSKENFKVKSMYNSAEEDAPTLLNKEGMVSIAENVESLTKGGGQTSVSIRGWWRGGLRWGRNRLGPVSDIRDYEVVISRNVDGGTATRTTNQISPNALEETVRIVEHAARNAAKRRVVASMEVPLPEYSTPVTEIWSEVTAAMTAGERVRAWQTLAPQFKEKDITSSGSLEMRCHEAMTFRFGKASDDPNDVSDDGGNHEDNSDSDSSDSSTTRDYARYTQSRCSITALHSSGNASGWAGLSSFDWSAVNGEALAQRALDRCVRSVNPVDIEPGRYTTILEPDAAALFTGLIVSSLDRERAERGASIFAHQPDNQLRLWRTSLGRKIVDDRITIGHDPMDPMLGIVPSKGLKPVVWIDRGTLVNLAYNDRYARTVLGETEPNLPRSAYRMEGGSSSIEDMIASTERGILVSRFSNVLVLNSAQLLVNGQTIHGLWLIEGGRITQAVSNMRFTETPLNVLNNVEDIGASVPVLSSAQSVNPIIVPSLKVKDFAFTATTNLI